MIIKQNFLYCIMQRACQYLRLYFDLSEVDLCSVLRYCSIHSGLGKDKEKAQTSYSNCTSGFHKLKWVGGLPFVFRQEEARESPLNMTQSSLFKGRQASDL